MTTETLRPGESSTTRPPVDERLLWNFIFGELHYRTLLVAHDLGIFSLLATESRTTSEIADALRIARRPAKALLTACLSSGLLTRDDDRYALAPVARTYLAPASPYYFGLFLHALAANDGVFSFAALKRAVQTNAPQVYGGEALFLSHEAHIELAHTFTHAMHGHSAGPAFTWPDLLDLSDARRMLDVGGGSGAHAIGAVVRWPRLRAVVLDLPPVCDVAMDYIGRFGVADRVTTVAANMWDDPFPAADLHFYADIIHDWPPEKCSFLMRKSFDALPAGGRIVLHEMLYDDDKNGPYGAAAYNVAMLLWTEGQQYSARELRGMLAAAGFIDVEVQRGLGYWSLVSATKEE